MLSYCQNLNRLTGYHGHYWSPRKIMVKGLQQRSGLAWFCACTKSRVVFNTGPYTVLPDNSILITASMQSEMGFPSSHQLKSYVASKSHLKLAACAVLSADAGLLVLSLTVVALQGKTCQDSLLSGGGRSVRAKISGGRGRPLGIFFGFYKTRHILLSDSANCTMLRAVVLTQYRRVTDRRRDRQTDGIAIA